MLESLAVIAKITPSVMRVVRRLYGPEELAASFTGEQTWARRLLLRRDGYALVASEVARTLRDDDSVKREIGTTDSQWDAVAEDVGSVLVDALGTRASLINLTIDPECVIALCLDSGKGRELVDSFRGEEKPVARISLVLRGTLAVVSELVRRANWLQTELAILQIQSLDRTEEIVGRTALLLDDALRAGNALTVRNSKSWPSVIQSALHALQPLAEYYPPELSLHALASDIPVTRIDADSLDTTLQDGLYWNGSFYGEAIPFNAFVRSVASERVESLVVVLGNPGSGKSTIVKDLVIERLNDGDVAVFARLEDVASLAADRDIVESERDAIDLIAAAMGRMLRTSVPPDLILDAGARSRDQTKNQSDVLIVLDGLDEVPTSSGRSDIRRLISLLTRCGYTVVLTSRISGYAEKWAGAFHLGVQPLEAESSQRIASAWFAATRDPEARRRYEQAVEATSLSHVVSNPLTLGFVCFLAHHGEVPSNAARVLERFVDHFLRRKWHPQSRWIDDDAQIASKIEAAADVAWSMAVRQQSDLQLAWQDSAVLAEIERDVARSDSPYVIYDAGLLIPYGALEAPTSKRYQRVRWMHRVIHEYFVAYRLRQKANAIDDEAWQILLMAFLNDSWYPSLHQTCQLLEDSPQLHRLISALRLEIEDRDTPDGAIGDALTLVGNYCHCRERRCVLAGHMAMLSRWSDSFHLDAEVALEFALRDLNTVAAFVSVLTRIPNYRGVTRGHVDALLEAGALRMADPAHARLVWSVRMTSDPEAEFPKALELARVSGEMPGHLAISIDDEPGLVKDLASELIRHFESGPSALSAFELAHLDEVLLGCLQQTDDLPARLALAIQVRALWYGTPDWKAMAMLIGDDPQPRDLIALGPDLERESRWTAPSKFRDMMGAARAVEYFNSFGRDKPWEFPGVLTGRTGSLTEAENVINEFRTKPAVSLKDVEKLVRALIVLATTPSSRVFDTLAAWRYSENVLAVPGLWNRDIGIDSGCFTMVLNGQDWSELVVEARRDLASGSRKKRAGLILITAADIWTSQRNVRPSDRQKVSLLQALEMFREGVLALLASDDDFPLDPSGLHFLPDGVPEDARIDLASDVIQQVQNRSDPLALGLLVGAERALREAGALSYFYNVLARSRANLLGS